MLLPSVFCFVLSFAIHEIQKSGYYCSEPPASLELPVNLDKKENSRAEGNCLMVYRRGKGYKKTIVDICAFNKHLLVKEQSKVFTRYFVGAPHNADVKKAKI